MKARNRSNNTLTAAWITAAATLSAAGIAMVATLGAAWIGKLSKNPLEAPSPPTTTPITLSKPTSSECNEFLATDKVCVAGVTLQTNSDEPKLVRYEERVSLKARDHLRIVNLRYCISPEAMVNRLEGKAYLFKKSVENYKYAVLTPSSFPVSPGCYNVGNFEKSWEVEPGQHRVIIPMILYDGSNKIVYKRFHLYVDVGVK
jgi:hypothetical protein